MFLELTSSFFSLSWWTDDKTRELELRLKKELVSSKNILKKQF